MEDPLMPKPVTVYASDLFPKRQPRDKKKQEFQKENKCEL